MSDWKVHYVHDDTCPIWNHGPCQCEPDVLVDRPGFAPHYVGPDGKPSNKPHQRAPAPKDFTQDAPPWRPSKRRRAA